PTRWLADWFWHGRKCQQKRRRSSPQGNWNALGTQERQSHARLTQCCLQRSLEGDVEKGYSATSKASGTPKVGTGRATDTGFAHSWQFLLSGNSLSIWCGYFSDVSSSLGRSCIGGRSSSSYPFASYAESLTTQFLSAFQSAQTAYRTQS